MPLPALLAPLAISAVTGGIKRLFGGGKPDANQQRLDQLDNQFDQNIDYEKARRGDLEKGYNGAMDRYGRSIDETEQRRSSLEGLGPSAFGPDDLEAVNPTRLKNFSSAGVTNFDPSAQEGYRPEGLGTDYREDPSVGGDLNKLRSFKSAASGFQPSSFDAGAAVKEYAGGAWSDASKNLQLGLKNLEQGQAGSGRLRSGYFDQDRGDVITEATRGYTSDLAKASVQAADITQHAVAARDDAALRAAGISDTSNLEALKAAAAGGSDAASRRLDALKSSATLKFQQAQGIDDSRQKAGIEGSRLELEAGTEEGRQALQRGEDLTASKQRNSEFGDTYRRNVAEGEDQYALGRSGQVLGARGNVAGITAGRAEAGQDRYLDTLTAGINRRIQQKNASSARNSSMFGGLLGLAGKAVETFGPSIKNKFAPQQ